MITCSGLAAAAVDASSINAQRLIDLSNKKSYQS